MIVAAPDLLSDIRGVAFRYVDEMGRDCGACSPLMTSHGLQGQFDPLPELVLFDLDNTLCDYDGARLTRTRYALGPVFDELEQLEQVVNEAFSTPTDGDEHFTDIMAAHGVTDPALVEAVRARYIEDRYRGLALFAEALEVVSAVANVAQIGMITNGPSAIQRPKIELLQIEAHFPVIVISEEAGAWKPDPRIFEIALDRCGVPAQRAVYVGDSAEHDIPGAHAAGLRAVWVNRSGIRWPGGRPPDAEIRDLYGLLPLLGLEKPG
jgi:FMN hydrolase / 5-amino-6-(5-phospho-D-ribitylamino)uracil phosphatase